MTDEKRVVGIPQGWPVKMRAALREISELAQRNLTDDERGREAIDIAERELSRQHEENPDASLALALGRDVPSNVACPGTKDAVLKRLRNFIAINLPESLYPSKVELVEAIDAALGLAPDVSFPTGPIPPGNLDPQAHKLGDQ